MKNRNLIEKFIFVVARTLLLYLIGFLLVNTVFEGKHVFQRARLKALNRMRPASFDYLVDVVERGKEIDKKELEKYKYFYKKASEYIGEIRDKAAAHNMLGFCSYYMGKHQDAVSAYNKAILLDADFIASYYNLGIIYFKKGDYEKAIDYFRKALMTKLSRNLSIVTSSRIYYPLFDYDEYVAATLKKKLRITYLNSYKLLVVSSYRLKRLSDVNQYAKEALSLAFPAPEFFVYYLGAEAYESKEYQNAMAFFYRVLKVNPKHAEALHYLGGCLKVLGQEEKAGEIFKRAAIAKEMYGSSIDEDKIDARLF